MSARPNPVMVGDGREVRVLDEEIHVAPLGVRCWDAVLDRPVVDGLVVRATPVHGDGRTSTARRSSTGVYGWAELPLQRLDGLPTETDFLVEIADRRGRFLATRIELVAPTPFPVPDPIVLFSAPDRARPDGYGAVRASLRIEDTAVVAESGRRVRPASYAMVAVDVDGVEHVGVADHAGEVVVFVPFDRFVVGVPPEDQTLDATIAIRFDPALPVDRPPLIPEVAAQPVRAHIEGPAFRPDHTFAVAAAADTTLTSPGRSELMLDPI